MIAEISNGGMRDSIGLLDQLTTYCNEKITINDVHEINGTINYEQMFALIKSILEQNYEFVYSELKKYDDEGKNLYKILESIIEFLKNTLIYINCHNYFDNKKEIDQYEQIFKIVNENEINIYIDNFLNTLKNIKIENNKRLLIELSLIRIYNQINGKKNIIDKEIKKEKTVEKNVTKEKKIKDDIKDKIEALKKIRINNTLATFNKKQMNELKNNLNKINDMMNNQEYSSIISLILDGELKAMGDNNLIFVYNSETLAGYFNSELLKIEELLKKVFNVKYNVIGVNKEDWEIIKKKFNDSIKNNEKLFMYQKEEINVEDIFKISNNGEEIVKNDIDNLFPEIVEYN